MSLPAIITTRRTHDLVSAADHAVMEALDAFRWVSDPARPVAREMTDAEVDAAIREWRPSATTTMKGSSRVRH